MFHEDAAVPVAAYFGESPPGRPRKKKNYG